MASEIGVQKLMRTNATQAATINSSGQLIIDDGLQKSEGGTVNTSIVQGLMKIWCQWDMDSGVGIADSFNTSSITDATSTRNRVHFTNNLSQADGSCFTAGSNNNGSGKDNVSTSYNVVYAPRTDEITYQSYSNADPAYTCVQGMGDLA